MEPVSQSHYYRALECGQKLLASAPSASTAERAQLLREWVDSQSAERAERAGWDCRMGCAHCCHHPVGLTLPEAQLLAATIQALPAAKRDQLTNAVIDAAQATAGALWTELTALPCPLLDGEGACSVYADRPIPCRALGSLDALACADPRRHATVPLDEQAFLNGLAASAQLATDLGHRELRSALAAVLQVAPQDAPTAFASARCAGAPTPASEPATSPGERPTETGPTAPPQ